MRFWMELAVAATTGIATLLTLLVHDWAELLFHVDADQGSGAFEVAVALALLAVTVGFVAAARLEWRRHATPLGM